MTPLHAFEKISDGAGGLSLLAHTLGYTKQNMYKHRENLRADPAAEVPPAMAATLAHFAYVKKIEVDFADLCPSIAKAVHGQFPARISFKK